MNSKTFFFAMFGALTLLGCGSGGGGSSPPTFPPPKFVEATSYGNKHQIVLDSPQIEGVSASDSRSVTFGDFFQEGEYSAFVAVNVGGTKEARFLKKAGGVWTDHTSALLADQGTRTMCFDVAQAITADFNGDAKPDVLVVCGMSAASPQYVFMSQRGSTQYSKQVIMSAAGFAINLQAWGAAAADIDGDGDADIVITDNNSVVTLENTIAQNGRWVLHTDWITGQGVGLNFPTMPRKVFLLPVANARPDLVVGGDGSANNITLIWMKNRNAAPFYSFNNNSTVSAYAQAYPMGVNVSATIYDVVKTSTNIIVLAKNKNLQDESSASDMVLLRYDLPVPNQLLSLTAGLGRDTITYTGGYISQFKLISTGQLVAYDGACVAGQAKCAFLATP